jgi:methionyl-tRNA synthetase
MLDSSGFATPSSLRIHGFLNIQGEKMSKSRGTFILAKEYIEKVNHPQAAEFLRFYYGSKLSPTSADLDLNKDELITRVNTTLANNIGNLHHRAMVFCERYFDNQVPEAKWDDGIAAQVESAAGEIAAWYESGDNKLVIEKIQALGSSGNKFFQDSKPWEMIKSGDKGSAASVIVTCVNLIKALAVFLKPVTPEISASFEKQLALQLKWDDHRFSLSGHKISAIEKLAIPLDESHLNALFQSAAISQEATSQEATSQETASQEVGGS